MLVADVSRGNHLDICAKDAAPYSANASKGLAKGDRTELLDEIIRIAHSFRNRCDLFGPEDIFLFGTEVLRKLDNRQLRYLVNHLPDLVVLDKEDEALCSLVSSTIGLKNQLKEGSNLLVIDQGRGSVEFALGTQQGDVVDLVRAKSYELGTQTLTDLLKEFKNDLGSLRAYLSDKTAYYDLPKGGTISAVVLMGSAATKLAAIKVRKTVSERYSPEKVHGAGLTLKEMDAFLIKAENYPSKVRGIIDPQNPQSNEYEIVVTGLIAISEFLHRIKPSRIIVSALGTRHGIPFLLASQDKRILKYMQYQKT